MLDEDERLNGGRGLRAQRDGPRVGGGSFLFEGKPIDHRKGGGRREKGDDDPTSEETGSRIPVAHVIGADGSSGASRVRGNEGPAKFLVKVVALSSVRGYFWPVARLSVGPCVVLPGHFVPQDI